MSVSLRPLNNSETLEHGEYQNISNGHWLALTTMAMVFGEDVPAWDCTHDGKEYTPTQLRAIAKRVKQIKDDAEWLEWLASQGGAKVT